eukprot:CFRG2074T1
MMGETHRVAFKNVARPHVRTQQLLTAALEIEFPTKKNFSPIEDTSFLDKKLKELLAKVETETTKATEGRWDGILGHHHQWKRDLKNAIKKRESYIDLSPEEVKAIKAGDVMIKENRILGNYEPSSFYQIYRFRNGGTVIKYPNEGSPENDVRIAYLFFISNADELIGMQETLDVLYETKHLLIIHVSRRTHSSFANFIREYYKGCSNIRVMRGRPSEVQGAELIEWEKQAFEYALSVGGWDIIINLCGYTVPIRSPTQIAAQFVNKKGISFVDATNIANDLEGFLERNPQTKIHCHNKNCSQVDETPNNLPVFCGNRWVALSPDFTAYVVQYDELADWVEFYTSTPNDVCIIQTILYNSGFSWLPLDTVLDSSRKINQPGHYSSNPMIDRTDMLSSVNEIMALQESVTEAFHERDSHMNMDLSHLFVRKVAPGHPLRLFIVDSLLSID